jgi:hypothetical protein
MHRPYRPTTHRPPRWADMDDQEQAAWLRREDARQDRLEDNERPGSDASPKPAPESRESTPGH